MDWPEWSSSHTSIKSISRCPLSSTISIFSDEPPLISLTSRNTDRATSSPHDRDLTGLSINTTATTITTTANNNNNNTTTTTTTSSTKDHSPRLEADFTHLNSHLLELQKEIKEEEDEIFADINSAIDSHTNFRSSYFSYNPHHPLASASVESALSLRQNLIKSSTSGLNNSDGNSYDSSDFNTTTNDEDNDRQQSILLKFGVDVAHSTHQWWSENDGSSRESEEKCNTHIADDEEDVYDEDDNNVTGTYDFNNYYEDQNQYCSNDVEEHMAASYIDQEDQTDPELLSYQVNNLPKPCVFFLEGNCRRSDCKYSHDLSNITCKYWIEGFCFKGELCPFLHSFKIPGEGEDVIINEDGSDINSNHAINPTFTIESEADFPSLPLDPPIVCAPETTHLKDIKDEILKANPAVVFKMAKKKRKRG